MTAPKARNDYKALLPWTVRREHTHAHPPTVLRLLGKRMAGEASPPVKERMVDKWLTEMAESGLVVCYHPDTAPNPASPKSGGWYYAVRRPTDGESLIRFDPNAPAPVVITGSRDAALACDLCGSVEGAEAVTTTVRGATRTTVLCADHLGPVAEAHHAGVHGEAARGGVTRAASHRVQAIA